MLYDITVNLYDIRVGLLYIWNPLTRLFKLVPKSIILAHYSDLVDFNHLGVGFDSVSNDYKILRVMMGGYSYTDDNFSVMFAELYSVNADSWKEIRVPKEMLGFHRNMLVVVILKSRGGGSVLWIMVVPKKFNIDPDLKIDHKLNNDHRKPQVQRI